MTTETTRHTPKTCGCVIVYCPTHEAAPEMAEELKTLEAELGRLRFDVQQQMYDWDISIARARALLRRIEGM